MNGEVEKVMSDLALRMLRGVERRRCRCHSYLLWGTAACLEQFSEAVRLHDSNHVDRQLFRAA